MDIPKSTVKEPLKFFHWILNPVHFNWYRESFFIEYELYPTHEVAVDRDNDTVSYVAAFSDNYDNFVEPTITKKFKDTVKERFYDELNIFIQNFNTALSDMAYRNDLPIQFFSRLNKILHEIEQTSKPISKRYPFIDTILNHINKCIEKEQSSSPSDNEYRPKEGLSSIVESTTYEEDKSSVKYIFGYFKNRMQSEKEYDRLIDHITHFVETGILPEKQQFKEFESIQNIDNDEIRYTFYILYCRNKNKKKIKRHQLCEFILLSFVDFSNIKEETLYKKLSVRPVLNEPYIPDFIKDFDLED